MDRRSGQATGPFQADACFAFHHVNAYDSGGEVVVDLCTYPDAGIIGNDILDTPTLK